MKTLLITGAYKFNPENDINTKVSYDIDLWGQSDSDHTLVYITSRKYTISGYTELIQKCKKIYCDYYKCDDYNLITLDMIKGKI